MVDITATPLEKLNDRKEKSDALNDNELRQVLAHCLELLYRSELEVERLLKAIPADGEKVAWPDCQAIGCFNVASPKYVNGLCADCWTERKEIASELRADNMAARKQYLLDEIKDSALYQRREAVTLLRQEGYSATDIADKLGIKIRQVYRDTQVTQGE